MNNKVMFNGNVFLLKCLSLPKVGCFTEIRVNVHVTSDSKFYVMSVPFIYELV